MIVSHRFVLGWVVLLLGAVGAFADVPAPERPTPGWVKTLAWRSIGPANMGGRITALAVYEADPSTWWAATASGGLLKTTNNGATFEHQFDRETTVSIGDVAVAPSDKNIVWVGTGESNPRNSASYGDGVYKSTDGGKTWKNMGLRKTFQIGKVVIHPTNPEIVYVGALGRLYGPSEERGLFKTTDGGKSWQKIHYVDDKTGVMDVAMNPEDPETLLIATYERLRDGFDFNDPVKKWGPGAGLFKTTDGGKTWRKLSQGLPTCQLGRIGICYYKKNPQSVYIILESEKIGMGPRPRQAAGNQTYMGIQGEDAKPTGARLVNVIEGGPTAQAGFQLNDVITQIEDKKIGNYQELIDYARGRKPGDKVKVQVLRGDKSIQLQLTYGQRRGGSGAGGQFDPNRPWGVRLGGQRENVQNLQGDDGHQYGGVYHSTDGGETWKRINSVNPRPMYFSQIRVDPSDERYIYVLGVNLYRSSDNGATFRANVRGIHADQHALWIDPRDGRHMIVGTDGGHYTTYDRMEVWDHHNTVAIGQFYHVAVDATQRYQVYGGLQDNGSWGGPSRTRTQTGPVNEDWIRVGGSDGFVCQVDRDDPNLVYFESQNGGISRRHLATGEARGLRPAPRQGQRFRFNWKTPFILSNHNAKIYYTAGNYVFRSLDRGNRLQVISPEITRTRQGSATALAESPRDPNVLYVGTDDGSLWVTRDGGKEWLDVTRNVGLPGPRWVASIEASRYADGRVYAVFDGHRSDDDAPHVFVSQDFGKTWKSLAGQLPWGSTRVLREDIRNENLLYLGTEFAVWASLDRGESWVKINNNLPTVAVHEFAQHPTVNELVAATHGRSIWILDVTMLRQLGEETLNARVHLYEPAKAVRWQYLPSRGGTNRSFKGTNPQRGAHIYYSLKEKAKSVTLKVVDIAGNTVRELRASTDEGMHHATWDLVQTGRRNPQGGRPTPGGPAEDGLYRIVLAVDGKEYTTTLRVEKDPEAPDGVFLAEDLEEEEEDERILD